MIKKHLPLIVGISLPIIFILAISIIILVPSFLIQPHYNFLYSIDDNSHSYNQQYRNTYAVKDGHLTSEVIPVQSNHTYKGDTPPLYMYDVKTNSSHQVSFDEVKAYTIDPGPSSPDGYIVRYEYGNGGIFGLLSGGNNDSNAYFIEKDSGKKKLSGMTNVDRYSYQGDFKLIGWIK